MSVKSVRARKARGSDDVIISFTVDAKSWKNIARSAKAGRYFGPCDYVAGAVNAAFLEDWTAETQRSTDPSPSSVGGMDDDIPF